MDARQDQSMLFVSFIIVARNAEKYLINLLADYVRQDYPIEFRELIMVDGGSEDDTKKVAQDFALQHPELAVTILDNPKQTLAPGWNIAIRAARGDIVCRIDAHVSIPPHYLSNGVKLLRELEPAGVVCVGGPWETKGVGFWGQAIAAALSSAFGVGNSRFRHARSPGYVDTVPCGLYWKRVFDQVGLFREDLDRNQDVELHARIRNQGGKFFLSPALQTTYRCRSEVGPFLQQAFGNGYWSLVLWRESSWRHLMPFFLVCFLAIFPLLGFFWAAPYYLFLSLGSLYVLLAVLFACRSAAGKNNWRLLLIIPGLFFLLHVTYGLGSCWALVRRLSRT
jgi:glycosyltransferase involved in cell wall biosynthesis